MKIEINPKFNIGDIVLLRKKTNKQSGVFECKIVGICTVISIKSTSYRYFIEEDMLSPRSEDFVSKNIKKMNYKEEVLRISPKASEHKLGQYCIFVDYRNGDWFLLGSGDTIDDAWESAYNYLKT